MIFDALDESSRILHESLAGMTEEEAVHRPAPESWSALDCVEHLVVAERSLIARIAAAEPSDPLPHDSARGAQAVAAVVNRSVRVEAPARARPSGRFATLAQALEQFDAARRDTVDFAEQHETDLPGRTVIHPLFGALTGDELILVIAGHTRRHAEQITQLRREARQT